jgi:uncharacterized protein YdeI (YjbR/CyaY-like superfamily)
MSEGDPRVEAFFAEARGWRDELEALRAILRGFPVVETFKWRSPCYTYCNANVATVWGFKDYCALSFFKGALLKDDEGVLVAPGPDSRSVRVIRFTSVEEIARKQSVVKCLIREAIEVEKAGRKVEFRNDVLVLPKELTARLAQDPAFRAAFEALTPGRQRGYSLHFSRPRQSATRVSRIEKCAPRILAGKGLHDR